MPVECPTCAGSRRIRQKVTLQWWQVLLGRSAILDELCPTCLGCGVIQGTPEVEERQRNEAEQARQSAERERQRRQQAREEQLDREQRSNQPCAICGTRMRGPFLPQLGWIRVRNMPDVPGPPNNWVCPNCKPKVAEYIASAQHKLQAEKDRKLEKYAALRAKHDSEILVNTALGNAPIARCKWCHRPVYRANPLVKLTCYDCGEYNPFEPM